MSTESKRTTEDVRGIFGDGWASLFADDHRVGEEVFDRWLAERDRQVAEQAGAQALRGAADDLEAHGALDATVPTLLRLRADSAAPARPTTDDREAAWRAAIAEQVRRNCTLDAHALMAMNSPVDRIVYAVADWIENPPEWSTFEAPAALASRPTTPTPTVSEVTRDPACVERWPDCHSGGYDPRCCRFPKSCSPHMNDARKAALGYPTADGGEG